MKRYIDWCRLWLPFIFELLAFIIPAWLCRSAALAGYEFQKTHLVGYVSDVGAAGLLYAPILLLPAKARRLFGLAVGLCYSLILYGNVEVIATVDGNVDLRYLPFAFSESFIWSSTAAVRSYALLLSSALSVPLLLLCSYLSQRSSTPWRARLLLAIYALCLTLVSFKLETVIHLPRWMQYSMVLDGLQPLIAPEFAQIFAPLDDIPLGPRLEDIQVSPEAMRIAAAALQADLDGELRFTREQLPTRPNIVYLILESLSAAFLEPTATGKSAAQIASPQRTADLRPMPYLYGLARSSSLFAPQSLAGNRYTVRGLYALLCGGYPNLVEFSVKLLEDNEDYIRDLRCLPRALDELGYSSHFLQAALLTFMNKGRYLDWLGFDTIRGASSFTEAVAWGSWGVDDHTLLQETFRTIEHLRRKKQPFLLTVLSAGTHHPYFTPHSFSSPFPKGTPENSAAYLDAALKEFFTAVQQSGALEDTLFVITADESIRPTATRPLSGNWIPIIVLGPGVEPQTVSEIYSQTDIPLSLMDYLGANPGQFLGRSVFRKYSASRYLPFSYLPDGNVFLLSPSSQLLKCRFDFYQCAQAAIGSDVFRSPIAFSQQAEPELIDILQAIVKQSDSHVLTPRDGSPDGFVTAGPVTIPRKTLRPFVFSLSGLPQLGPGHGLDLSVAFEVTKGRVLLELEVLELMSGTTISRLSSEVLSEGDTAEVVFSYRHPNGLHLLQVSLSALSMSHAGDSVIEVRRPQLLLRFPDGKSGIIQQYIR